MCKNTRTRWRLGRRWWWNHLAETMVGCPPSWIFRNLIFLNCRWGPGVQYASLAKFHQNRSHGCWNIAVYNFSRWRPFAILDLWGTFWDHTQRLFGGLYHYAKFGWNCCSSFDNTKVWVFCAFGWKMPIHSPFVVFWGKIGDNGHLLFIPPGMQ